MKVLVLAGLITVAMTPLAFAGEDTTECQLDETRRAEQRPEAPATTAVARPTIAQRDVVEPVIRPPAERRRSGKRIPDAQLIGPRGAL